MIIIKLTTKLEDVCVWYVGGGREALLCISYIIHYIVAEGVGLW